MRLLTATGTGTKLDGFDRVFWTPGNFSPGDGSHEITSARAGEYVRSMRPGDVACVDLETVCIEPGVPLTHSPQRDALVIRAANYIDSRVKGSFLCLGLDPLTPFAPLSHNFMWDDASRAAVRERANLMSAQCRRIGTVSIGLYICDPPGGNSGPGGSLARDVLAYREQVRVARDLIRGAAVVAWLWSGTIFPPNTKLDRLSMQYLVQTVRETADWVVLWDEDEDDSFTRFADVLRKGA